MMRRPFPLLLLLVAVATPPARALPVTGYAIGQVTENRSFSSPGGGPRLYEFTVGEAVYVRFTYDLDPPASPFPDRFADHGRPGHRGRIHLPDVVPHLHSGRGERRDLDPDRGPRPVET